VIQVVLNLGPDPQQSKLLKHVFSQHPQFKKAFAQSAEQYLRPMKDICINLFPSFFSFFLFSPHLILSSVSHLFRSFVRSSFFFFSLIFYFCYFIFAPVHPRTDEDATILQAVNQGALPSEAFGFLNGIYFASVIFEDLEAYSTGLDSSMIPLLQAMLALISQPHICCYVRQKKSVGCQVVKARDDIPKLAVVRKQVPKERWQLLLRGACVSDNDVSAEFVGNGADMSREGCILLVLQYLAHLSQMTPGHPSNPSEAEIFALLATFLDLSSPQDIATVKLSFFLFSSFLLLLLLFQKTLALHHCRPLFNRPQGDATRLNFALNTATLTSDY